MADPALPWSRRLAQLVISGALAGAALAVPGGVAEDWWRTGSGGESERGDGGEAVDP